MLFVAVFCSSVGFSQTSAQRAASVLRSSAVHITTAADLFGVSSRLVAAVIFVEQVMNVTWVDRALDVTFANYGFNTSVGIGQVKIRTAEWIEETLKDSGNLYFLGNSLSKIFPPLESTQQLAERLNDPEWNTRYVAANLAMILNRWSKAGVSLAVRPDILGTLYSTGVYENGAENKKPRANPKPNQFGRFTKEFVDSEVLVEIFPH